MTERGLDWDTLQCKVKVKELRNAYHKAREANCCSSALPMSCRFYKELDVIFGGDPTSTVKATVHTSVAHIPVESGPSQEEILDEDVEGDPEAEDDSEVRDACSEELFSTPEESSRLQLSELGKVQTGKEAPLWLLERFLLFLAWTLLQGLGSCCEAQLLLSEKILCCSPAAHGRSWGTILHVAVSPI
ncbi:hypothetical protein UY3_18548 [Chelonia mydas]|uniref:Zinc finger and SCAN domain-containing protein 29 n=1 Tax=Chelonia mydas TaxID=8469 RepID=M7B7U5_CHEMY|nr:hypothetical protein UY3_18548 [Chelonia mydas]